MPSGQHAQATQCGGHIALFANSTEVEPGTLKCEQQGQNPSNIIYIKQIRNYINMEGVESRVWGRQMVPFSLTLYNVIPISTFFDVYNFRSFGAASQQAQRPKSRSKRPRNAKKNKTATSNRTQARAWVVGGELWMNTAACPLQLLGPMARKQLVNSIWKLPQLNSLCRLLTADAMLRKFSLSK